MQSRKVLSGCLAAIYAMLVILVIRYTYQTTRIDPTDYVVYLEREAQSKGYDQVNFDVNNYEYFCNVCKTHVLENTKHCQACNRCVQNFDHHCPWLNNCIGSRNYREFLKMLSWVTATELYQQGVALIALRFNDNFQSIEHSPNKNGWIIIIAILCLNTGVLLFLVKLLSFHIYLLTQNITTYQYILRLRERATQVKQQSKVILQKNKVKDSVEVQEQLDKKASKEMSERNQLFINATSPPDINISEGSTAKPSSDIKIIDDQFVVFSWFRQQLYPYIFSVCFRSHNKNPPSIKVKPINSAVGCGIADTRNGNDDIIIHEDAENKPSSRLKGNDEIPVRMHSQINHFDHQITPRSDETDQVHNMSFENKQKGAEFDIPHYSNKRSSMGQMQNKSIMEGEDTVKFQGKHIYKIEEESREYKARTPLQERTPQQQHKSLTKQHTRQLAQATLQYQDNGTRSKMSDKPLLMQHISSQPQLQIISYLDPSIMNVQEEHLKQSLILQNTSKVSIMMKQHSVDYNTVKEYEESNHNRGRSSRNQERVPSEMQSVQSKKNKHYEHKVLL